MAENWYEKQAREQQARNQAAAAQRFRQEQERLIKQRNERRAERSGHVGGLPPNASMFGPEYRAYQRGKAWRDAFVAKPAAPIQTWQGNTKAFVAPRERSAKSAPSPSVPVYSDNDQSYNDLKIFSWGMNLSCAIIGAILLGVIFANAVVGAAFVGAIGGFVVPTIVIIVLKVVVAVVRFVVWLVVWLVKICLIIGLIGGAIYVAIRIFGH